MTLATSVEKNLYPYPSLRRHRSPPARLVCGTLLPNHRARPRLPFWLPPNPAPAHSIEHLASAAPSQMPALRRAAWYRSKPAVHAKPASPTSDPPSWHRHFDEDPNSNTPAASASG